jgi:tetratricopeptide (TPR) repeat protein
LRGGKTRVLITSRSDEAWLGSTNRFHIPLGGLKGEELWDYCTAILRDFNFKVDRNDPELSPLLKLLDGHPLTMRAVLPELERRSLTSIIESLEKNLAGLSQSDADIGSESRLYATLGFLNESVPDELQELRIPLSLHERYVDGDYLSAMAEQVDEVRWPRDQIDRFLSALCTAGLLRDIGQSIYEMHPLLSRYLRALNLPDPNDRWHRGFVDVMGTLADNVAPKPLHEQRSVFHWHGTNFEFARQQAEHQDMGAHLGAITQALPVHALNTRRFDRAVDLFEEHAEFEIQEDREDLAAATYHQLGIIAEEQRDFAAAETWYRKALAVFEKLNDAHSGEVVKRSLARLAELQQQDSEGDDSEE